MTLITRRRRALALRAAVALVLYLAASVLLIGRHALSDPQHVCACIGSGDPTAYTWALGWWPYALTHGLDPVFPHLIWSPVGTNLATTTMIPLPSVLSWPVTATLGPVTAYDVLSLLSPVAAATAMYLLCRRLTGHDLASFAGGWLYGFSTYELSQIVGHANLMLIALQPLAVLVVLLRGAGRLRWGWFILVMALLLLAQVFTSTEILATSCLFGALALFVAWCLARGGERRVILRITLEVIGAGLVAAVVASPYLLQALGPSRPPPLPGAGLAGTDLASLIVPLPVTLIQFADSTAAKLPFVAEQGSYFGPLLLLAFLGALGQIRRRVAIVLAVVAVVALLLSLGSRLAVSGHRSISLPWRLVESIPVANVVLPDRLILYAWFSLAVGIALWLARPGRFALGRWVFVVAGIVLILPDAGSPLLSGRIDNPALFTTQAYRRVLPAGGVVLALPFGLAGSEMLWQAESGFAFAMPEGYVGYAAPPEFRADPVAAAMLASQVRGTAAVAPPELRIFLARYHVEVVMVDASDPAGWPAKLEGLGLRGRRVGGVILYRVPAAYYRFSATFGAIRLNTTKPSANTASTIPIGTSSPR